MKKYIILLFIAIISINIHAQTKEKKGYIGVVINPSYPVGNFASHNLNNSKAGYAKEYYSFSDIRINFGYRFGKNIGISAEYFTSDYAIDSSAIDISMSVGGIKIGPMFSIPIGNKLFFDIKTNIGYTLSGLYIDSQDEMIDGFGLVFDFGASFRYNLFKRWCLLADGGYMVSNQKFDNGQKSKFRALNWGLGVGLRL